jgi:Ras-related protein Rab-7A
VEVDGTFVTLHLWDTAGQERYRSLASSFFRGSAICVLVYDVTSEKSFHAIESWHKMFEESCSPLPQGFPFLLLGNKIDDVQNRQVAKERGMGLAEKHGFLFHEVSAKLCENIMESFDDAVRAAFRGARAVQEMSPVHGLSVLDMKEERRARTVCEC